MLSLACGNDCRTGVSNDTFQYTEARRCVHAFQMCRISPSFEVMQAASPSVQT